MELPDHPTSFSLNWVCILAWAYSFIKKTNIFLLQWSQIIVKVARKRMRSDLITWFDCIAEILIHAAPRNGDKIVQIIVGE